MKTTRLFGYAGISGIALALLTSPIALAEAGQSGVSTAAPSHNLVHRVSHSLADAQSYTRSGTSGYKWGKDIDRSNSSAEWVTETTSRSGYKWGDTSTAGSAAKSYAGEAAFQWSTMSFPEQAGYKWGIRGYISQAGYKWGIRSSVDQAGYKWGIRSHLQQAGYKWGIRGHADQTGYKWGIR